MSEFYYSARDEQGKRFAGSVEAETQAGALEILSERYAFVTRLEKKPNASKIDFLRRGVKGEALLTFSQTLAAMLDGGITIKRALDTIYGDTESHRLRVIIMDLSTQIGGGTPFSQALAGHPNTFDQFFVKMVAAGESSGELPEMLKRVSDYIGKTESLKDTVKSALTYPMVVISFALILLAAILAFGIPYLSDLYDGLGVALPLPTQVVVSIGNFISSHLVIFGGIVLLGLYGLKALFSSTKGQRMLDRAKLGTPVMGEFFRTLYTARFARTLALLYSSGVPLLAALQLTGESVGNQVVADTVEEMQKSIESGINLSDCLRTNPYFLDTAIGMVAAGEESGKLDQMLSKVADFYEHKVYTRLEGLTSTIEPLIMIFVGIAIGLMIVTLGLPFMSLASAL